MLLQIDVTNASEQLPPHVTDLESTNITVQGLEQNYSTSTVYDEPINSRQTASLVLFWVVIGVVTAGSLIAAFSLTVLLLVRMKKRKQIHPSEEEFQSNEVSAIVIPKFQIPNLSRLPIIHVNYLFVQMGEDFGKN